MRNVSLVTRLNVVSAACMLTFSPRVFAQAPAGSYQASCSNVAVSGTTLSAACKALNGQTNDSTLKNFGACVGDIANFDGTLSCSNMPVPDGSYQKSCRFAHANAADSNHSTLDANCKTRTGSWNWTQLAKVRQCVAPAGIANRDGILTCESPNATVSPVASVNSIRILLLDGNTGEPMANAGLFLSLCCSANAPESPWQITNASGEIVVSYAEGTKQLSPMMANGKYKYCQDAEAHGTTIVNPSFFALDEIRRAGVVAPNTCNAHVRPLPRPGVLVFFLRQFTWWETITKPPQM